MIPDHGETRKRARSRGLDDVPSCADSTEYLLNGRHVPLAEAADALLAEVAALKKKQAFMELRLLTFTRVFIEAMESEFKTDKPYFLKSMAPQLLKDLRIDVRCVVRIGNDAFPLSIFK